MRRYRKRSRSITPVQSFKKVLNWAPTSRAAALQVAHTMVTGTDSVAAGQTTPTDSAVPTGSIVKYFDITVSTANLVNIASFMWITIQHLRSGQTAIDNQAVGGDPQRNQVHLQIQRVVGQSQNTDTRIRFKVPAKFQRVREGDTWVCAVKNDALRTDALQIIYKFYR